MYKDVEKKINFYKEHVRNELIKSGVYPNAQMVQERLDNIDTWLALFKHSDIQEGAAFDTDAFNESFKLIYKDLEFLYSLLCDTFVQEYVSLKAFADAHLDELEDIAAMYALKAEQEINSTSLGTTLLFKNSGFDTAVSNNITTVTLGSVDLHKGSRIACFIDANNIEPNKIVFALKKDDIALYTTPYNYNQDSILVSGELSKNTYTTTINDNQIIRGPVEINLGDVKASNDNQYLVFVGKDKVLIREIADSTNQYITERPTSLNMLEIYNKAHIDFYVVGGNKISFRFNKKPISTNFPLTGYQVMDLKPIEHFSMECEPGFAFDFELDSGVVYAIKERGVVDNEKLYFSRSIDVRDFYVEEYAIGETDKYDASVNIYNDDGVVIDINSIMIKELLMIGDVIK
jgi:hypothetical protein